MHSAQSVGLNVATAAELHCQKSGREVVQRATKEKIAHAIQLFTKGTKQNENEETSQLASAARMGCCVPNLQASSKQPENELATALPAAI